MAASAILILHLIWEVYFTYMVLCRKYSACSKNVAWYSFLPRRNDVTWTYVRHSEDFRNLFWMCFLYVHFTHGVLKQLCHFTSGFYLKQLDTYIGTTCAKIPCYMRNFRPFSHHIVQLFVPFHNTIQYDVNTLFFPHLCEYEFKSFKYCFNVVWWKIRGA